MHRKTPRTRLLLPKGLLLLLFHLIGLTADGQQFFSDQGLQWERITVRDGLPSNAVYAFLQDSRGYLWIGTDLGVVRYDGYTYQPLHPDFTGIRCLFEDREGYIWMGSFVDGLSRYDPRTETFRDFTPADGLTTLGIWSIVRDTVGTVWLGTRDGLQRLHLDTDAQGNETVRVKRYGATAYPDELLARVNRFRDAGALAEIVRPEPDRTTEQPFTIAESGTFLVSCFGEKPSSLQAKGDFGWIENAAGETVWQLDWDQTFHAGGTGFNRIALDTVRLAAGDYRLVYQTDATNHFGAELYWFAGDPAPDHPDLYGIQVFDPGATALREMAATLQELNSRAEPPLSWVREMAVDRDGTVWAAHLGGLGKITPRSGAVSPGAATYSVAQYSAANKGLTTQTVHTLEVLDDGKILLTGQWAAGDREELLIELFDPATQATRLFIPRIDGRPAQKFSSIWASYLTQDRELWLGNTYADGLVKVALDQPTGTVRLGEGVSAMVLPAEQLDVRKTGAQIRSFYLDAFGVFWVGTRYGLNKFSPSLRQFASNAFPGTANRDVNSTRGPGATLVDCRGRYWLGTSDRAIFRLDGTDALARVEVQHDPAERLVLISLYEDAQQRIWAGSNLGLLSYDEARNVFVVYRPPAAVPSVVWSVYESTDGSLWAGTEAGLQRFDRRTRSFEAPPGYLRQNPVLASGSIRYVTGDRRGRIWAVAWGGVAVADLTARTSFSTPTADVEPVRILLDNQDQLWLLANVAGLYRVALESRPGRPDSLRATLVTTDNLTPEFPAADGGHFWASGIDGVHYYHADMDTSVRYSEQDGLLHNQVASLLTDTFGNVWMLSQQGISSFQASSKTVTNFTEQDGLLRANNQFFNRANLLQKGRRNGEEVLYFPMANGVTLFYPQRMTPNPVPPRVVLSGFKLFEAEVRPGDGSPLEVPIALSDRITLPHDQNFFSIAYTGLQFDAPAKTRYRYRLEGFDEAWITAGTDRVAKYTNVPPGAFRFRVQARNAAGSWSDGQGEAVLALTVLPPWWRTTWAYLLFGSISLALLWAIWRYDRYRYAAQTEARRILEMDRLKTRLYTNITHEFRTPLTVILGMADQVANQPDRWLSSGVSAIRRNAGQLLRLVNQMLNLSKLESGHLALKPVQSDIIQFLRYALESFHSFAESKDISLHFQADPAAFSMDFDPDRLMDVLSNLLSNAIKFTPEGGDVYVEVRAGGAEALLLTVRDTGVGMPAEQLPHIFDRFYQADDSSTRAGAGTGIGLALTRELVRMMGGDIRVQSRLGQGTTLTVSLPVSRKAVPVADTSVADRVSTVHSSAAAAPEQPVPGPTGAADHPLVLIIEDHADVRQYIASTLEKDYRLAFATNGRAGIERAVEKVPDIIVSDVMMPEKDGFEVCYTLKNDRRCSHIPIILLTAKADVHSRLKGLRRGADAYLPKPFNKEELRIRIHKLLEQRQKLQSYYSGLAAATAVQRPPARGSRADPPKDGAEDAFVREVRAIILARLSDPDFTVPALAREVALSPSQLHRKLKALTGQSSNQLIRAIRLERARELLRDPQRTIAAIAYDCGFNSANYFDRVFKRAYGITPTAFRERGAGEGNPDQ